MRIFFPLLLFLTTLTSCGSDAENVTEVAAEAQLVGSWELTEARRDNVKTNLLEGLYFVFGESGKFETNLLTGEAQSGTYLLEGSEITTQGVAVPMTYEISVLEDGQLGLRSRYQGFVFDFNLRSVEAGTGGDAGAQTPQ